MLDSALTTTEHQFRYLIFNADIQAPQVAILKEHLAGAVNAGRDIYLIIASTGGNVREGLSLATFMKTLSARIITHNAVCTNCVAAAIFAAGTTRYAAPDATFRLGPAFISDRAGLFAVESSERVPDIKQQLDDIAAAFAAYTGLSVSDVQAILTDQDKVMTADEALAKTIIHEIREVIIPPRADIVVVANG